MWAWQRQQGLVFEGNDGAEQWVRAEALSDLFRLFSENVECVLLNACYSEEQANAIVNHIDYVIGMNQEIRDDAAIAFSKEFYLALGYDRSIEQAFKFGCNAIQLEISGSSKMRSGATDEMRKIEVLDAIRRTPIPEHLKPILKTKPTLTPRAKANITASEQSLTQETRTAIQLDIDKVLGADVKVKQYRDRVREFLSDRKLSAVEKIRLEQLQKDLGISESEAAQILEEEWQPIQKTQDQYREMLIRLIEEGHYPLNKEMQDELQVVRREMGISDEEAAGIAKPILDARWFEFEVVTVDTKGQITDRRKGEVEYRREDLGNGVTLDLVSIPSGKFLMGSPDSEEGRSDQHEVTVSPFWMGKYPVTQFQWRAVATLPKIKTDLESDPSNFKGGNRPVEQISWDDAVEFCARLSKQLGREYRLPSEAEWEYACRAGTKTPFYFGETITPELANYDGNYTYGSGPKGQYQQQTTKVGIFPPNAFGLYDMHGNVWEWCQDQWHENYQGAPTDGSSWVTGGDANYRVLRGGSWVDDPRDCRSASRLRCFPDVRSYAHGFRVVCSSA